METGFPVTGFPVVTVAKLTGTVATLAVTVRIICGCVLVLVKVTAGIVTVFCLLLTLKVAF